MSWSRFRTPPLQVTGGSLVESRAALALAETDGELQLSQPELVLLHLRSQPSRIRPPPFFSARLFCTVGVHPTRCAVSGYPLLPLLNCWSSCCASLGWCRSLRQGAIRKVTWKSWCSWQGMGQQRGRWTPNPKSAHRNITHVLNKPKGRTTVLGASTNVDPALIGIVRSTSGCNCCCRGPFTGCQVAIFGLARWWPSANVGWTTTACNSVRQKRRKGPLLYRQNGDICDQKKWQRFLPFTADSAGWSTKTILGFQGFCNF